MIDHKVANLKAELAKRKRKTLLGRLAEKVAYWVIAFLEGKQNGKKNGYPSEL